MESRSERQAREKVEWITQAVEYMLEIRLYSPEERNYASHLADSLWYHSRDEGGEMIYNPQEAVDEELTYWGD